MGISPPGGLPYHPKESNREADLSTTIITKTGLFGICILLTCALWSLLLLTLASPFLLCGLMEIVAATPTHYRVRWIRKDPFS